MSARKPIVSIGGARKQLPSGDVLITDIPLRYNFLGAIAASTGSIAYEFDDNYTLVSCYFYLQTASSSGNVTAIPRHNGSALGTMTVAASGTRSNKVSLGVDVSAGSKITVDITAAGTSADSMCVVFIYRSR